MNMKYDSNKKYVSARTPVTIATLQMMIIKNLFGMAFEFGILNEVSIWKLFHSIQTKNNIFIFDIFIQFNE